MDTEKQEIIESREAEVIEQSVPVTRESVGIDAMDRVISLGGKLDKYNETMKKMRSIVISQAYAGDWISHSRGSDPAHLRKANIGAAGAERIACFLGFQESNWKIHEKKWSEDEKHYSFAVEADFTLGGRTVHSYTETSTRNKFYSFEKGQWKEITDVREDHVKKAAVRECRKEGIRTWLGLRSVPISILQKEGMDPGLINYVNFQSGADDSTKSATAKPSDIKGKNILQEVVTIIPISIEAKVSKNGKPYHVVEDNEGVRYSLWGTRDSERVKLLKKAVEEEGTMVQITVRNDGKFRTIDEAVLVEA